MGSLILCHKKRAKQPYEITRVHIRVYTIEELCYYVCNNLYLIDHTIMNPQLCQWIRTELSLPRLAQAAPYWPQREVLCQTALQFLDRADVLFLEESDLLLLFGSRELRTALFALFTGHVQLIFFYKKDRILAFTRSVMASAAKKDQSPALVLYRMEKMMLPVSSLPRLKESELNALIG